MDKKNERNIIGWLFSTPYVILAIVFFLIPLCWAIYLSFTDWNLISAKYNIVFFDNYAKAFKDSEVRQVFVNTIKYAVIVIPFSVVISFIYAFIIYRLPQKFKSIFMVGYFLPYISSGVAVSIIVNGVLSYNSPFSTFMRTTFGMSTDIRTKPQLAIVVISIMVIWKMSSYYFLFFLSSLESLGKEIEEAAKMDGANTMQTLFKIIIPNLYPAFYTVISLSVGLSYSIFTEPYMLTSGGPEFKTATWQLLVYNNAFIKFDSGYAATIAIINAILVFANIYLIQKLLKSWGRSNGFEV